MGMKMRSYWIVTYFFDFLLYSLVCIVFIAAELIYQVRFFTQSSPLLIFLLFFLWGHCQIAMSFFLSAFFNKARAATVFGYLLVIISVIAAEAFNGQIYKQQTPPWWYWIYPPFAFYRCIYVMFMACFNLNCLGTNAMSSWNSDVSLSFLSMSIQTIVLLLLTYYFNAVFPSEYGLKKHPLFFLSPLYPFYQTIRDFIFKRKYNSAYKEIDNNLLDHNVDVETEQNEFEEDEDVVEERERVLKNNIPLDSPLVVCRLIKNYSRGFRTAPKRAVNGVTFAAHKNECFGLLGPNGAGKSTTISMLTGLFPATSGTARIGGFDMNEEMNQIHRIIGVCPQFDTLWEELSISEHLMFYARLKGIPPSKEREHVDEVIDRVGLLDVKKRAAKRLSGGMKRRLSLGISLIGDPQVVFLDEPTTGLDPESRRSVWDAISRAQQGRCMVLTTHSMEEADCLCSRIAIMGNGRLQCIGTQVHLKNKFGRGYKLSISFKEFDKETAQKFVTDNVPSAQIEQMYPGMIEYRVPAGNVALSDVFEKFEEEKEDHGIIEWGIAQGSLEQVFLRIVGGEQNV